MKILLKLSACVFVAAGYVLLLILQPFSLVTFLLGVFVCNWLANLFHELGHLLAYCLLKLEFKRLVISFFVFEKGKGLRFEADRRVYAAACTCVYDPKIPAWRYSLALLSGGIFGVLLGVGTISLSFAAAGSLAAFMQCFGAVSLLNGAANLLLPGSPDRVLMEQIKKKENAE